jgi:toxin YoeB
MEIKFTDIALEHLDYFKKQNEQAILKKIRQLLENISIEPKTGIGKPEQLKHQYSGYWSRRINREHRLIYLIESETIFIHSLKGHY